MKKQRCNILIKKRRKKKEKRNPINKHEPPPEGYSPH
jgi:hypothetical protein